jgi:carnitine 3-dehydrogenase / betainyl-CoA thioesterase
MRHFLEQFGPALEWPWTRLTDVPRLDGALVDRIVDQSDQQAGGRSVQELERIRDDNLVALLHALRARGYGAGEVLRAHELRLADAAGDVASPDPAQPLRLHRAAVDPSWIDYNGHMTEARYLQVFSEATDAFLRHVGLDADYLAGGASAYTVETHLCHLHDVAALEPLEVSTQVLAADDKRVRLFQTLSHGVSGELLATGEHLLLHVDTTQGRVTPWREPVASRLAAAAHAHAELPRPARAGRAVGDPAP